MEKFEFALRILEFPLVIWIAVYFRKKYLHWKKNKSTALQLQKDLYLSFLEKDKQIFKELEEIKLQLFPNHGTSLNDKIILYFEELLLGQQNVLEIIDKATFKTDKDGRVVYVSLSLCDLFDCTPNQISDHSWLGLIAKEERDWVKKEWFESIRNASQFTVEFNIRKCNGEYQKVKPLAIHNKNKSGKVMNSLVRFTPIGEPFKNKV